MISKNVKIFSKFQCDPTILSIIDSLLITLFSEKIRIRVLKYLEEGIERVAVGGASDHIQRVAEYDNKLDGMDWGRVRKETSGKIQDE